MLQGGLRQARFRERNEESGPLGPGPLSTRPQDIASVTPLSFPQMRKAYLTFPVQLRVPRSSKLRARPEQCPVLGSPDGCRLHCPLCIAHCPQPSRQEGTLEEVTTV